MKAQAVLRAVRREILQPEAGDRTGSGRRIYKRGDDRLVPATDRSRCVDRRQQRSCLVAGDFRGLALDGVIPRAADRRCRIQNYDVPVHEHVEKCTDRRQVQFLCRDAAGMLIEIRSDHAGRDAVDSGDMGLGPFQELANSVQVGSSGVPVADLAREEFIPGESGRRTGGGNQTWPGWKYQRVRFMNKR